MIALAAADAEHARREPMTLEQWADLDEDEPGELVEGRLVEEEVPTNLHELVVAWLIRVLGNFMVPRGGRVLGSEHKLGVSKTRGRKPDVAVYAKGMRLRAGDSLSRTPPALVVEVLSPRPRDVRRDRKDKLAEYARFGVHYYWIVDPQTQLLEIFEFSPGGEITLRESASEGKVAVPGFEDLELDLSALWCEVQWLEDEGADEGSEPPNESGEDG